MGPMTILIPCGSLPRAMVHHMSHGVAVPSEFVQETGVGLRMCVVQRGPCQSLVRYEPPVPGFPTQTVIANAMLQPWKEETK